MPTGDWFCSSCVTKNESKAKAAVPAGKRKAASAITAVEPKGKRGKSTAIPEVEEEEEEIALLCDGYDNFYSEMNEIDYDNSIFIYSTDVMSRSRSQKLDSRMCPEATGSAKNVYPKAQISRPSRLPKSLRLVANENK